MKKLFSLLITLMLIPVMGCGLEDLASRIENGSPSGVKNTRNPAIIGTWKLVVTDETTGDEPSEASEEQTALSDIDYGMGIEFTEDGKLRYGFDSESLESIAEGADINEIINGMEFLVTIYYEVNSDTELNLTVSALMGIKKESQIVEYSLDGDTLVFDGATYTRV